MTLFFTIGVCGFTATGMMCVFRSRSSSNNFRRNKFTTGVKYDACLLLFGIGTIGCFALSQHLACDAIRHKMHKLLKLDTQTIANLSNQLVSKDGTSSGIGLFKLFALIVGFSAIGAGACSQAS